MLHAVTTGALDRATDVAATLEVRGFGAGGRPPRMPRPWSRHDFAFAASAVVLFAIAVGGSPACGRSSTPTRASRRRSTPATLAAIAVLRGLRAAARSPTAAGSRDDARSASRGSTYRYPGASAAALDDVSLTVEPGELVLLAGGSGSGKSTLLRAACGLVPHFHGGTFGGRVVSGGLDTREHGPAQLAAVAGTLFQDPETQVVMGTVRAELAFPLENLGWAAPAVARGVEEAALALGLGGLLDRSTHELSGGELQRVALAASLAGRPRLLLLDEPTSQLDPVAGDELLGVLRRLNEEWGTAILLAEHRLERCLPAADRVIELRDGRVVADETPRAWLARTRATPAARLFALAGLAGRRSRSKRRAACSPARAGPRSGGAARSAPAPPRRGARGRAAGRRGRLGRAARRAGGAARRHAARPRRRADRADGPQRRGQVDAAEGDRRACSTPTRGKVKTPRDRAAHPASRRPPDARDDRRRRARTPSSPQRHPQRRLRRRAPALRARARARRARRGAAARRADARDGPAPPRRARRSG